MRKRSGFGTVGIVAAVIVPSLLMAAIGSWWKTSHADYRRAFEFWRQSTPPLTREESTRDIVRYRAAILDTAAEFQVNPIVIAGVIYTEQTRNRNPANYFEDYYIRNYLLTLSEDNLRQQLEQTKEELRQPSADEREGWNVSFRGHHPLTWSIGLGRMSVLTALELEDELHLYEHRERRGVRGVLEALLDPRENLRYCAFELQRNRAIYSEITGYDINGRPDLEASLYNLGHVRAVAERTVREMRHPLPNSFGEYVQSHIEEIRVALDAPSEQRN
jgi:hypothetical protein